MSFWTFFVLDQGEGNAADEVVRGELITGGFTNENVRVRFWDKKRKLFL